MHGLQSRQWRVGSVVALIALALAFGLVPRSFAGRIPGGGSAKADCYAEFDIEGVPGPSNTVVCTDGEVCDSDGAVNNTCTFKIAICGNQTDASLASCTPKPPLTKLTVKPAGSVPVPSDLSSATCGDHGSVQVPVKVRGTKKKPGKKKIRVIALASGKPKKDADTLKLICNPCLTGTCGGSVLTCGVNPDGGPDQLDLEVAEQGTDLDNGWTGTAHNFPVDAHSKLKLCLSGCNDGSNPADLKPVCNTAGPTGTDSLNGVVFGPPLPLLAAMVPVCVVNRYQGDVTGTMNLQTGDAGLQVNLFSDVWFTQPQQVCPRCTGAGAAAVGGQGTCDSGPMQGKACTVESILVVAQGSGNKNYPLSAGCPPPSNSSSQFAGTLDIKLPLTSGTSTLPGTKPCQGQPEQDNCGGSGCGTACGGLACSSKTPDGTCVDAKGGLSQNCCNNSSVTPCFPAAISRTGKAMPASPAWGSKQYPATGTGTLVATFCEAATQTLTINSSTGLPGPGALILPGTQTFTKKP